jgi:hypothetical protein
LGGGKKPISLRCALPDFLSSLVVSASFMRWPGLRTAGATKAEIREPFGRQKKFAMLLTANHLQAAPMVIA